uniref:BCL2 interacting protein 5 n=1 Tax=Equus asinus asinus TaxID=83772 RepID=A0A8C4MUV9_EQUAS
GEKSQEGGQGWSRESSWELPTMEPPQGPRRRAGSLDRTRDPRRDSDTWDCRCLSLPTTPSKRALRRTASEGARRPESPAPAAEAQGATATALSPEESKEFLPREQRSPQDAKKDKAQRWAPQGWLKTLLNIFLRTGLEEPKEKASRRAKGKDGPPQPAETPEAPGELASRKKAHDRKASRKKHGHKKRSTEEARGAPEQEVGGWEAGLPAMAAAVCPEEADLGPACGGEQTVPVSIVIPPLHPQGLGCYKLDACIQMIVEFLKKVGDQWEEEQLQGPKLEAAPQNPSPALRRKSQRKKSGLKRAFSLKKHGSEEAKRAGAADVFSAESRPPRRPTFLPLCVGGQRPSTSGSFGMEEPEVQEALSTDVGGPSPFELSTPAGSWGPEGDSQVDGDTESRQYFLSSPPQQLQVQQPEVAVENLGLACRKKSQEKKPNFRRAFSQKKYGFKEPKRAGAADAASPESRPPKRPSFLPLCVGGQRPSSSSSLDLEDLKFQESSPAEGGPARSSEAPSQARSYKPEEGPQPDGASESTTLMTHLRFCFQIGRHPSLKRYSCKLSDSSLRKLAAALGSREAQSTAPHRNLAEGSYQFAFGLANTFAGNNSHTVLSLRGLHFSCHSYTHFPHGEAPQNIASPETQSPD